MQSEHLLLLVPPALALVFAWFGARSVKKGAAEIDAMRAALRRRQQERDPAE